MTRMAIAMALTLVAVTAMAGERIEPDGAARIQSAEAQTILLDGKRYDVSGATVRLIAPATGNADQGATAGEVRTLGTVSENRPILSLLPPGTARVLYRLDDRSDNRIRVLWIAAEPNER